MVVEKGIRPERLPAGGSGLLESKMIRSDVLFYRETLERLSQGVGVNKEYRGSRDAFSKAIPALDGAFSEYLKGPEEFAEHKFSREFRKELSKKYGLAGERFFLLWRDDNSFSLKTHGKEYTLSETGSFGDAFYGGIVKDMPTCVDPRKDSFHVGGVIGTIELPWIKQVIATLPDETEFIFRRRMFVVDGADHAIILVQPRYHGLEITEAASINDALMDGLRSKYEGNAEVREMPNEMLSHEVKTKDYPEGINTGYRIFGSGRAPFFYIDSNCHSWKLGDRTVARNGLHSRRQGESTEFPRGWSSEYQILPDNI